ncbi:MAG: bifunctional tRNA (5-methylaminomethyl-2-thiouridine)(34)-methyltransferase MnmD/FAD-dependent 5-carboxymethylaminomethyl-2-thiouridine(34) oxidoreductase MnmC [Immundisolibacteraceae bacterium]|nr:bifunctional tRNA (5-methylaminomethyl-2-thiouridine)(34)-methyltransferase MnmD/FAD-dependent 5-carboxymethylaminomethyl-2-thiouridine(34) oxidoreductase MnmC [Immundisolibacteraceae bacterium]
MEPIKPVKPEFAQGRLQSTVYDDHYFGANNAIEESRHLYVLGNHLPERFADCRRFGIGELGFGTDLNFLLSWQAWREHAPITARLNYLAVEKHPIDLKSLSELYLGWPELAALSQQLIDQYPLMLPGSHRLCFDDGRVVLTLLWGDAKQQLADSDAQLDCWFLDGFSPRSNPELWDQKTLSQVARLTRVGGSFSTFSVAGAVRRQLAEVGFDRSKVAGFGSKAQMLVGELKIKPGTEHKSPWYRWPPPRSASAGGLNVAIVGGGIAGCCTAYALTRRGYQVTLIEQGQGLAVQASGNPAGILSPFISADHSLASQFSVAAFEWALATIKQLKTAQTGIYPDWFHQCGQLRLATDGRSQQRHQRIIESGWFPDQLVVNVDGATASREAEVDISDDALLLPLAGFVEPLKWCQALVATAGPNLRVEFCQRVETVRQQGGGWQLLDHNNEVLFDAHTLVLANANDAQRLLPHIDLSITPVSGQVALLPVSSGSESVSKIVSFDRYLLPALDGYHLVGASFGRENVGQHDQLALNPAEHDDLFRQVDNQFPGMFERANSDQLEGRVSLRSSTPDHLPLVGPLSTAGGLELRYQELHHGRADQHYPVALNLPGLYLNVGHGSRGLVSAPLSAELIASHLSGDVAPLSRDLIDALHPDRFRIRKLMKRP